MFLLGVKPEDLEKVEAFLNSMKDAIPIQTIPVQGFDPGAEHPHVFLINPKPKAEESDDKEAVGEDLAPIEEEDIQI